MNDPSDREVRMKAFEMLVHVAGPLYLERLPMAEAAYRVVKPDETLDSDLGGIATAAVADAAQLVWTAMVATGLHYMTRLDLGSVASMMREYGGETGFLEWANTEEGRKALSDVGYY